MTREPSPKKSAVPPSKAANGQAEEPEFTTGRGNPFVRMFPTHPLVWREARRMASDRNVRVEDLAAIASQDPVIVIELLRAANAMSMSGERRVISTTPNAIVRLGSDIVIETLEGLVDRPQFGDLAVRQLFEVQRYRCKRAAIISRMLAELVAKFLADECQTAGLFVFLGELLAVAHYGNIYVKLYENHTPAGVNARLVNDHKFDVMKAGVSYLQRQGIPESILFALDRDAKTRQSERAIMKPVCFAAAEVVDAFDTNRWEKLSPGRQLPPKSALRSLGLNENSYLRFYERATEYLFNERSAQDKLELADLDAPPLEELKKSPLNEPGNPFDEKLEAEIQELLSVVDLNEPDPEPEPEPHFDDLPVPAEPNVVINDVTKKELFSLKPDGAKTKPRMEKPKKIVAPPPLRTEAGNSFVSNVQRRLSHHRSSEALLRDILGVLTEDGPFEKSALIVVSKDRQSALVVAARGPEITCGQTLILTDPLSPLAQCFSKVQSFGNKGSSESPWGSKAFALAPIDADHETPVALYADCGIDGSLSFEARRIFRAVVELLNQKLPAVPGGIPVEV